MTSTFGRRGRANKSGALVLIAVSLAIAVAVVGVSYWNRAATVGEDLCLSTGPSGLLAIGIDATDTLSDAQRLDVKSRLENAISVLPANWRVEIWNIAPVTGVAMPVGVARCKPEVNVSQWTANPRRARARWDDFLKTFQNQLSASLSQKSSDASPILEALQAIGLRTFGASVFASVKAHRLILVSDLIQNTDQLSLMNGLIPYEKFQAGDSFNRLRAPLAGTEVEILFLSRRADVSASELIRWWQQYVADSGAQVTSVQRIVG